MRHPVCVSAALALVAVLFTSNAHATTIANVVCDVERVQLIPDDTAPTHVVVHGVFSSAVGGPTAGYGPTERGYLYFRCAAGQETSCRMHWTELKAAVGSTQCAGVGQAGETLPTVRKDGAPLASPDVYALGLGVLMSEWHGGACARTKAVPDASAMDAGVSTDGSTTPAVDSGAPPAAPGVKSGGCAMHGGADSALSWAALSWAALALFSRRSRGL